MAVRQSVFRFYANDGAEATSTPLAAINTSITRQVTDASTFLIRFLVQCDSASSASNLAPQFQRNLDGGAFGSITTSSTIVRAVTTTVFANAENTTNLLGGSGTFETSSAGCTHDGLAGGAQFDIVANGKGETVCAVQLVPADIAVGNVIEIRLAPTPITIWDVAATVTITEGAASLLIPQTSPSMMNILMR